MKRLMLIGSMTAACWLGLADPLLADESSLPGATSGPSHDETAAAASQPAEKCLTDLQAFDGQIEKEGYWLGGSGFGYGYPMAEADYRYGYPLGASPPPATAVGYLHARPGYEVRVLVAAANILAHQGQEQPCEDVLATTRAVYKLYAAEMQSGKVPMADVSRWRIHEVADAERVTNKNTSFRSDELLGTDVRDPQNEALGSVEDIVMTPETGKIAYLVIARGGIFGFGDKYVPIPWNDFKVSPNGRLLVLDTTKGALDAAPQVSEDQFAGPGRFDQESQQVDAYWKAHLTNGGTSPKG